MTLFIHHPALELADWKPGSAVPLEAVSVERDLAGITHIEVVGADAVGMLVLSDDSEWTLQVVVGFREWLDIAVGALAAEIDARAVADAIPVKQRLQLLADECYKNDFWASVSGRHEPPFYGCAGFMAAAERWYSKNYGKQAVGEIGPLGHALVELSGAVAGIRIPLVFGSPPALPVHVDGLGENAKSSLTENHWTTIHGAFRHGLRSLGAVLRLDVRMAGRAPTKWSELLKIAADNYAQSTVSAMDQRFNDSAFFSQQAAEKSLKALLAVDGKEPPHGHHLDKLLAMAERKHGHTGISQSTVSKASFPMDIRYEVDTVSPTEAVEASRAALEVLGRAASILVETVASPS